MPIIYKVTVTPAKKQGIFHITWHNMETGKKHSFDQSANEIATEEVERLWQEPQHQLTIGQKLFRFLDGNAHHFQQALDESARHGEPFQLLLRACKQTDDWPFELLAQASSFLLPQRLHLVRWVSDWGAEKKIPPQDRQIKLLFMACSALDVKPELDFEREEEVIFKITENHAIDMEVEDSGSLDGLRRNLVQTQYDVVHLSGHADIDQNRNPYFVMENESGYRHDVYPDELWNDTLIENPPRLLFLSGCRKGETPYRGAAVSFAHKLVEKHNVPAVLGWGRSVTDEQAIHAEKMLYHQLSLGKTILKAVQRARDELEKEDEFKSYPAWPLLRLFSGGMQLSAIVTAGQRQRPQPRQMTHIYLENSRVQVLAEGFVGRRRQLQQSLRALQQTPKKVGVLILGTGGLGKSCLAGKICERFIKYTLVIVHGKLNAITLESALKDAFIVAQDEKGREILSQKIKMEDKLANLCATSFKEKNYLMLLDDFEQNLEGAEHGQPGPLLPEAAVLLQVLLHYLPISGKMTQMMITSRYLFSLKEKELDLIKERLEPVPLTSFRESEQLKKARELKHIFNYEDPSVVPQLVDAGRGNPRLMEWLDVLVGQMAEAEVPQLLDAIRDKQEEFIRHHVIRELLIRGGDELAHFLRWFSIFRRPVFQEGVQIVADKANLEAWEELLHQGLGLSLVEYDEARQSYGVTPLLREELLGELKDLQSCHEAAFAYYKQICEPAKHFDPMLVEEWIFHALGCGEEDVASKQGGMLVKHLRDRLAFQESVRVGQWILAEKKRKLSIDYDAFLLNELAYALHIFGDQHKAIDYYEKALNILREVYGEKHQIVAISLNNLGEAWRSLGEPLKAIKHYENALNILNEVYGEKHQDVAISLNNLGSALEDLGEHSKAIDYFQQSLSIFKKVYGEKHPKIATALNNLGEAWRALGKPRVAIGYYQQALNIDRAVFDEEHPDVAKDLNNLGLACKDLEKHHKAIDYFQQALNIDLAVFGEEHPNVARELNNLGSAWKALGEHRKAIVYYEKALTIWTKVYGEKHPNVASTLNNLGAAYFELQEKKKAKEYFEKAYAIKLKFYEPDHPSSKLTAEWLEKC